MSRIMRTSVRIGLAVAATTALVASGLTSAQAALQRADTISSTPTIRVAMTDKAMYLEGSTSFPAGRLRLTVEDAKVKHDAAVAVVKLAPGYAWKAFRTDLRIAFENLFGPHGNHKKGLKHLNHAIDNITAYGGLLSHTGKTARGTLLLTEPGTYALYNDSGSLPRDPRHLTVGAAAGPQTPPTTDATVVAQTNRRFGGDKVLPANGTVTFQNNSTESPHFLVVQHVKEGTTRKQVIRALQSNNGPGPFLNGDQDTDVLSYAHSQSMKLHLPKGEYALMCFFPDPKTGMIHALMGMVNIVHLK